MLENAHLAISEKYIKKLHFLLENGTSDSRRDWFKVGEYKKLPNEVGGRNTSAPERVGDEMKSISYSTTEVSNNGILSEGILLIHASPLRIILK